MSATTDLAIIDQILSLIIPSAETEAVDRIARTLANAAAAQQRTENADQLPHAKKLLHLWLLNRNDPIKQRIALRALIYVEQKERRRSGNTTEQASDASQNPGGGTPTGCLPLLISPLHQFYVYTIAPLLATWRAVRYRPIVRGVLPEALQQQQTNPLDLDRTIETLVALQSQTVSTTAAHLRSTLFLIENRRLVGLLIGSVMLLLVIGGVFLASS